MNGTSSSRRQRRATPPGMQVQQIIFGPIVFQCLRIAWKRGLLAAIEAVPDEGASIELLATRVEMSHYAISVLLESALSAGVVQREKGRYRLTRVGDYFLHDPMTRVNFDFIADVCYEGMARLEASLDQGRPLGLKGLGDWPTLYDGLSNLPQPARNSWFAFDHFYSDSAFSQALDHVLQRHPGRMIDIGANTGRMAIECLLRDPAVEVVLVDLPIQLAEAERAIRAAGLFDRVELAPIDLLDPDAALPQGGDAIWMSQFLTCFSLEAIDSILSRCRTVLPADGDLWILDTFWDRQHYEVASYCLINTSPYFTAIASGNSKMYESTTIVEAAERAGLVLTETIDSLGICHSLLRFRTK